MVGIIILNYKNWKDTVDCVKSIIATTNIEYSIFIVDNNSLNDSVNELSSHFSESKNISLIILNENRGYSAGNNAGIKKAICSGCTSILIANPDVIFQNNAIEKMILKLESSTDLGIVGPKVLCDDLSIQKYTRKPLTFKRYVSIKKPFSLVMKKTQNDYLHTEYTYMKDFVFEGMVSGCCFAIKNDVLKNIGYFDENVFLFCEEDIIGIKLKQIGKKTCVCIDAEVIHKGSTTIGKKSNAFSDLHRYVSAFYVLNRYVKMNISKNIVISIINIGSFLLKSIREQDYRKKIGLLVKSYRKILKE